MHAWSKGDQLTHRFNSELGTGQVTAIEGRVLVVHFPDAQTTLRLAANSDALMPATAAPHRRDRSLLERLAAGDVDTPDAFLARLDALQLVAAREAGGLGSMLGGRVRLMVSGGAPLAREIMEFFHAIGVLVLEGYGLTETTPILTCNRPNRFKFGTVGPPLEGVEVKIADDGEILVRGELVMRGYWKDPGATASTLRDGWLHTGDIGELDANRYLKITDRKKDMIVNSGGDNVAPARVEGILLLQREIGQALTYGDRRPHLVALVVPHQEFVREFARAHGTAADLATLFQPFRQIDTGLARLHEGTGLGLAICRRLATLLGGEITAASEWGRGSEFTVILPLRPPAQP